MVPGEKMRTFHHHSLATVTLTTKTEPGLNHQAPRSFRQKVEVMKLFSIIVLSLVGLGTISIALTAILTRYEGTVDVRVGPRGGYVRVVGPSAPPSLPSVDDEALPPGQ